MGNVLRSLGNLIGIGSTPKADVAAATSEVDSAAEAAKKARTALLETAGGQAGSVLSPGQVQSSRNTLLGN